MKKHLSLLCALCAPFAALAHAAPPKDGMTVTASKASLVPEEDDPQARGADGGGTTSIRFETEKLIDANKFAPFKNPPNRNRIAGPDVPKVQQRDRDLGQTFLTGSEGFTVDAMYLRLGFTDRAVLAGARGAKVALQFLEVRGTPRLNDSGTPGFLGQFDRGAALELDDYLEGETFRSLRVVRGTLPPEMQAGDFLKFDLHGRDEIRLAPNKHYAFMLMLTERKPAGALALANNYYGAYKPDPNHAFVGHGLRREGGVGKPDAPHFRPDLPDDLNKRAQMPPGTLGFPDVCTWRDLYFVITSVPDQTRP